MMIPNSFKRWALVPAVACATAFELVGCDDPAPEPQSRPAAPTASIAPSTSAPAPAAKAPKLEVLENVFASKVPEGLVPLDLGPVDVEKTKKSADMEKAAAKLREGGKHDEAVKKSLDALKLDPGNVSARYELARSLTLDGKPEAALGVLYQLRQQDCMLCVGRLLDAATEEDFKSLQGREFFKKLTNPSIAQGLPALRDAAKQTIDWLEKPDLEHLPPGLDSRTTVLFQNGSEFKTLTGAKELAEFVTDKSNFPNGRQWTTAHGDCMRQCCHPIYDDMENKEKKSLLKHICFDVQKDKAISLFKIMSI